MSKILILMTLGITALIWFLYPNKTEVVLGSQAKQVADTKSLIQKFNHKWDQILKAHVDANGNVNYLYLSNMILQIFFCVNCKRFCIYQFVCCCMIVIVVIINRSEIYINCPYFFYKL